MPRRLHCSRSLQINLPGRQAAFSFYGLSGVLKQTWIMLNPCKHQWEQYILQDAQPLKAATFSLLWSHETLNISRPALSRSPAGSAKHESSPFSMPLKSQWAAGGIRCHINSIHINRRQLLSP